MLKKTIGKSPKRVVSSKLVDAFGGNRLNTGIFWMQLVKRKVPIHPRNLSAISILVHYLVHCFVKSFTKRAFKVRVFHYFDQRIWVALYMVAVINRPYRDS